MRDHTMKRSALLLAAFLLPLAVFGADVAFTLMPPAGPVTAGGPVRVDLAAMNPGGFAVRHYRLTLPSDVSGRVVLEVNSSSFGLLRTVLDVQPAVVAQAAEPAKPETSTAKETETQFDQLAESAPVA